MKRISIVVSLIALAAVGCNKDDSIAADPKEVAEPASAPAATPMDEAMAAPAQAPVRADDTGKNAREPVRANDTGKNEHDRDEPVRANNTEKNERDRDPSALTPGDQGESASDRTITQQARQGVVAADAVSLAGKNVKIITIDGVVTLRGPVESAREKTEIAQLVNKVDGVKRVDNQLEVAAK